MKSFTSNSLEETERFAKEWLEEISRSAPEPSGKIAQAFVVGLFGHLGAGKTAFVKIVAKILGVKEEITSPTFVIMKNYKINHPKWKNLIHIDAYRLEQREELEVLDFEGLVSNPENLIMIEWPEKVRLDQSGLDEFLKFETVEGGYQIEYVRPKDR